MLIDNPVIQSNGGNSLKPGANGNGWMHQSSFANGGRHYIINSSSTTTADTRVGNH
jgi:hypothetical protein